MKAIVVDRYGGPDALRLAELPTPAPKDHEILVRNRATVATPPDVAMRSANPFVVRFFSGFWGPRQPVLGDTVAGEVVAAGSAVTLFRVGDRVTGSTGPGFGSYAEFAAMPETAPLIPIPEGIGYAEAAALVDGFLTAICFIRDAAKAGPGRAILVNGAAGSIGASAVQLARHYGATVTGVCSTRNVELVKGLGADHVIDRTSEDFTAGRVAYDAIFDAVGKSSFARCRNVLKPGGVYLTTVPSLDIMLRKGKANADGKRADILFTGLRPDSEKLSDLRLMAELVATGKLRAVIDRRYPLSEMADAHRYVETGRKVGSVVVDLG